MKMVNLFKMVLCLTLAALAALLVMGTAFAQEAGKPVINLSATGEKIAQFGVVVKDVDKVAKRYSEVFGTSWRFYDFKPKRIILHDKELGDVECLLKVAVGDMGGRSFKLIQPVSGPSTYMEFLQKHGEGLLYFSLGTVLPYNRIMDALKKAGVGIEMQGRLGGKTTFTILDTLEDLGCYIELISPTWNDTEGNMQLTGVYEPKTPSIIDMAKPLFSGGKRITQVGIVLKDEKRAAKRYQELLGVGPWNFYTPERTEVFFNEKPVAAGDPSERIDTAMAYLGDIQLELVKTAEGPNPQRKFLEKRGNGIHHLSIGWQPDYDQVVGASKKAGINTEFSGGQRIFVVSHLAMQEQLGGLVLEIIKPRGL
jgi:methylmalonyl-CoA/ethylmalonyl-CoA epimerase